MRPPLMTPRRYFSVQPPPFAPYAAAVRRLLAPLRPLPFHFRDRPLLSPLAAFFSVRSLPSLYRVPSSFSRFSFLTLAVYSVRWVYVSPYSVSLFSLIEYQRRLCQSNAPRCSLSELTRFTGRSSVRRGLVKPALARE